MRGTILDVKISSYVDNRNAFVFISNLNVWERSVRRLKRTIHRIRILTYVEIRYAFVFITNLNAENVRSEMERAIHRIQISSYVRISSYVDIRNAFVFITNLNAENVRSEMKWDDPSHPDLIVRRQPERLRLHHRIKNIWHKYNCPCWSLSLGYDPFRPLRIQTEVLDVKIFRLERLRLH